MKTATITLQENDLGVHSLHCVLRNTRGGTVLNTFIEPVVLSPKLIGQLGHRRAYSKTLEDARALARGTLTALGGEDVIIIDRTGQQTKARDPMYHGMLRKKDEPDTTVVDQAMLDAAIEIGLI